MTGSIRLKLIQLTFGSYLALRNSFTGREQEMCLVALTPVMSTGEKLTILPLCFPLPLFQEILYVSLLPIYSTNYTRFLYARILIFLHHPVKSFCFQFVSSILVFVACSHLAFSWIPISCVSRMLSYLAGVSLMVVLLQPPKTICFLALTIASSPLPHYKQKHLQCAVENPTELAEEWPAWPNVSFVLLPAEFRCW